MLDLLGLEIISTSETEEAPSIDEIQEATDSFCSTFPETK
jgi:hypothetical protein